MSTTLFIVFDSILFPLTCVVCRVLSICFYFVSTNLLFNILVEYNLEKFVSVEERYVAGESRPVE